LLAPCWRAYKRPAPPGGGEGGLALRLRSSGVVEQSSLDGFYLDSEAFSSAALDVDGGQLAALDLVQHGLACDSERGRRVAERELPFGGVLADAVA